MVVQRRDGRRRQRDDDDDDLTLGRPAVAGCGLLLQMFSVLSVGHLHCCEFRRKKLRDQRHSVRKTLSIVNVTMFRLEC